MSRWEAVFRKSWALVLIALGIIALLALRQMDAADSTACDDNVPFFLSGTFDDCSARNPKPSATDDRELHARL